jgi:ADP-ribosylglycohydrolase
MGKPVEGLTRSEVATYLTAAGQWPQRGYVKLLDELPAGVSHLHESAPEAAAGRFSDVPRDDDIDWTILGLALLEEHGSALSTEHIAAAWLDRLPFTQTFTAERAAYRNLVRGVPVSEASRVENPYREWIGALIRGDIFGYAHPGNPGAAARAARVDARLSHVQNGIFGEVWAAALVAAALGERHAEPALRAALSVVPEASRLAESQRVLLDLRSSGATADEALDRIDADLGHYNWVHTVNNAALITLGLLWGEDFVSSVALTISGGRDTDSAGATVGSVYGALHGVDSIPAGLVGTTHVRVRSAVRGFDRIEIRELADRTMALIGGAE